MQQSFKYRIYPNKIQSEALNSIFYFCKDLYNGVLQERRSYYHKYKEEIKNKTVKHLSYNDQSKYLPEIKSIFTEETKIIYSQTLQFILKTVDNSFKNFFRKCKINKLRSKLGLKLLKVGFPRFKSINRFKSICFPQCNFTSNGGVKLLLNNKIKIYGIPGEVKIKMHRPFQGRCKTVQIKKEGDNYFIVLSCDNISLNILPKTNNTTAIDLGLTNFITSDAGQKVQHPKPYKTAKEKLAIKQRELALKQKGSKNRRKAISALRKVHTKIVNIRNHWQHEVANDLIKNNDLIIVEKLNIESMLEDKGYEVNKSNIQDASWGNFVSLLKYKAEKAGRLIKEVDPRNTSKMCSCCGNINKELTLRDRIYKCIPCGMQIDRDVNAALNIRRLGTSLAIDNKTSISEACGF